MSTDDPLFDIYFKLITGLFTDKFPIHEIIEIKINTVHKILAPSYVFNSDITENSQIKSALETYKINEMLDI